jgi:hypothetical protein
LARIAVAAPFWVASFWIKRGVAGPDASEHAFTKVTIALAGLLLVSAGLAGVLAGRSAAGATASESPSVSPSDAGSRGDAAPVL